MAGYRWVFGAAGLASACIIPDAGIDIQGELSNPGAVRIVESIGISDLANDACGGLDPNDDIQVCPVPPKSVQTGILVSGLGPSCVCQAGDLNKVGAFQIFVEDPDRDEEGDPEDDIIGALLLDPIPDEDPSTFVAYENYLPTTTAAALLPRSAYSDSIERPDPGLKSFVLGQDTGVDLCNDNSGAKLEPGIHDLRIVVTDRPWYIPVAVDKNGAPVMDGDEYVRMDVEPVVGVPDIPGGASYAVASFVFRCGDVSVDVEGCNCDESE